MTMVRTAGVLLLAVHAFLALGESARAEDGLRKVDVRKYGIVVRVPQAWLLVDWAQNDRAFVLKLPQDAGSKAGMLVCELSAAPAGLLPFQQHEQSLADKVRAEQDENEKRKLVENKIEPLDAAQYGKQAAEQIGQRLTTVWQHASQGTEPTWYEARVRLVSHHTLYTFTLTSDEAHYESYLLDFEDMLRSAQFSPPETGLRKLPGGYWLQPDFRFALRLPEGWQPAFAPQDKVLFFATGQRHEAFTDNLLVLASPAEPLDLALLKQRYAESLAKTAPEAVVESCEVVPHGNGAALETVIHTKRGPFEISVLERRFRGAKRNYEVKFTCETSEFKKQLDALRKSLDSFQELHDAPEKTIL
jgi:hypothetical protein